MTITDQDPTTKWWFDLMLAFLWYFWVWSLNHFNNSGTWSEGTLDDIYRQQWFLHSNIIIYYSSFPIIFHYNPSIDDHIWCFKAHFEGFFIPSDIFGTFHVAQGSCTPSTCTVRKARPPIHLRTWTSRIWGVWCGISTTRSLGVPIGATSASRWVVFCVTGWYGYGSKLGTPIIGWWRLN